MAVIDRNLTNGTREGHRQFARRVVIAKQHVGDGVTAFSSGEPGFQQRVCLLILFHQRQWTTVHQHQHQRFTGRFQGANQVTLALRNVDVGTARRFVRHTLRFADNRHDHIRLFRRIDRFVDHLLRRARIDFHRLFVLVQEGNDIFVVGDVRPFGVHHVAVFTQRVFNTGQHGNGLIGDTRCGPAAHHVAFAISQRADHSDSARFFQRQGFEAVFQQYQAFARHFTGIFTMQAAFGVGINRVRIFRP
ncbi:hypothetical protein D3C72_988560 [compost metagenome]